MSDEAKLLAFDDSLFAVFIEQEQWNFLDPMPFNQPD
jgi:hypothetical protein